jgi:hypothetical protein
MALRVPEIRVMLHLEQRLCEATVWLRERNNRGSSGKNCQAAKLSVDLSGHRPFSF